MVNGYDMCLNDNCEYDEGQAYKSVKEELGHFIKYVTTKQVECPQKKIFGRPEKGGGETDQRQSDSINQWTVCLANDNGKLPKKCKVVTCDHHGWPDWSFEMQMVEEGCDVVTYKPKVQTEVPMELAGVQFYPIGIDVKDLQVPPEDVKPTRTLLSAINEQKMGFVDVVKYDMEFGEIEILPEALRSHVLRDRVKQFTLEIHVAPIGTSVCNDQNNLQEACRAKARQFYVILRMLEAEGFRLYDIWKNPFCEYCWQLAYVNAVFFPQLKQLVPAKKP